MMKAIKFVFCLIARGWSLVDLDLFYRVRGRLSE